MSHHCKSLILHCMDFRLGGAIKTWLAENHLLNNCDIVSLAGAAKNLVSPKEPADSEMVFRQIELAERLHEISEVILMNHTDCGAYGGHDGFESNEAEETRHQEDMRKAKELILSRFPNLEVRVVLAKISPLEQISFEEIK